MDLMLLAGKDETVDEKVLTPRKAKVKEPAIEVAIAKYFCSVVRLQTKLFP